jgi:hypothetical protein
LKLDKLTNQDGKWSKSMFFLCINSLNFGRARKNEKTAVVQLWEWEDFNRMNGVTGVGFLHK